MILTTRAVAMLAEWQRTSPPDYAASLASEHLTSDFARNIRDVPEAGGGRSRATDFQIALAMTGGMDSSTMWRMAQESGLPYRLIYLDMGQPYAAAEQAAIRAVTGQQAEVHTLPMPFVRHRHILSGRNAILVLTLAALLTDAHQWGEVWLGNLQGESPVLGGDKSRRFFGDITALLTLTGQDVRLVNPVMGLSKVDLVRYWQARGELDQLKKTHSCFEAKQYGARCGRCQACFNTWVAYVATDVACADLFPHPSFDLHVAKYGRAMREAEARQDYSHYSRSRIAHTLKAIATYHSPF